MGRCLIVANQTLGGPDLDRVIRERIEAGQSAFHVVVPTTDPRYETDAWLWGYVPGTHLGKAHQRARHRLEAILSDIAELGGDVSGQVGDSDPVRAVREVLDSGVELDEVLVSTLPSRLSRWLKLDVPSRVSKLVDVPVRTIEAADV